MMAATPAAHAPRTSIPGPGPLAAPRAFAGWFSFLEDCHRRYGDVFRIHYPFLGRVVVLADPDAIREIYVDHERTTAGSSRAAIFHDLFDTEPLPFLDGAAHLERRRLLLASFHGSHLAGYEPLIAEIATAFASDWKPGHVIRLRPVAHAITAEVITRVLFGIRDRAAGARFRALLTRLIPAWTMIAMLPDRAKTPRFPGPWRRFTRIRRELRELILTEIRRRRAGASPEPDLCSLLVSTDGALSDDEVCDELLALGLGASHTTSLSLAWTFDYLLHDAHTLSRLERDPDDAKLCAAVIDETLRVRTPVDSLTRVLVDDVDVAGWRLSAGEIMFPSIHLVHRREDLYERPDEFRPERFLAQRPTTYGWLPFGAGTHRCIGAAFAQLELRVIMQQLLRRWRMRPRRRHVSRPRRSTVFWVPAGGVPVEVTARATPHPGP